jgi:nitrite reductase/ring-hydroxylating ferredoxin subunit
MWVARTRIAGIGDLPPGAGTCVDAGDRTLAVFNVDGALYAVDNTCPHRGGPLGEGDLDGTVVTCPWHGWRYDVTTGAHEGNPSLRLACDPVTLEDGVAYVNL